MDVPYFRNQPQIGISFFFFVIFGLFSPMAMAQEEFTPAEGKIQRLEEVPIPQGTIQQLDEIESINWQNSSFAIGGTYKEGSENEIVVLELDSEPKYDFFGLVEVEVHPHFEDWLALNHGEGPRGRVSLPIIQF